MQSSELVSNIPKILKALVKELTRSKRLKEFINVVFIKWTSYYHIIWETMLKNYACVVNLKTDLLEKYFISI